ncbi:unnamed protein product [Amoebophrya sp. A120]|nr:unnamed protein product [Amoebophrya sp. A120]|eukprot:GSA120T00018268001.1
MQPAPSAPEGGVTATMSSSSTRNPVFVEAAPANSDTSSQAVQQFFRENKYIRQLGVVMLANGLDIMINYPTWILSKRMSAGLGVPRGVAELYRGGLSFFCAGVGTLYVEDFVHNSLARMRAQRGTSSSSISSEKKNEGDSQRPTTVTSTSREPSSATGTTIGSVFKRSLSSQAADEEDVESGGASTAGTNLKMHKKNSELAFPGGDLSEEEFEESVAIARKIAPVGPRYSYHIPRAAFARLKEQESEEELEKRIRDLRRQTRNAKKADSEDPDADTYLSAGGRQSLRGGVTAGAAGATPTEGLSSETGYNFQSRFLPTGWNATFPTMTTSDLLETVSNPTASALLSGMMGGLMVGTWAETFITKLHMESEKVNVKKENFRRVVDVMGVTPSERDKNLVGLDRVQEHEGMIKQGGNSNSSSSTTTSSGTTSSGQQNAVVDNKKSTTSAGSGGTAGTGTSASSSTSTTSGSGSRTGAPAAATSPQQPPPSATPLQASPSASTSSSSSTSTTSSTTNSKTQQTRSFSGSAKHNDPKNPEMTSKTANNNSIPQASKPADLPRKNAHTALRSEADALRSMLGSDDAAEYRKLKIRHRARNLQNKMGNSNAANAGKTMNPLPAINNATAPFSSQLLKNHVQRKHSVSSAVLSEVSPAFLSRTVLDEMSSAMVNHDVAKAKKTEFEQKMAEAKEVRDSRLRREVKPVYQRALRSTFLDKIPPYGTSMIMMREATYTVSLFYLIAKMESIFFERFPKPERYVPTMQMAKEWFTGKVVAAGEGGASSSAGGAESRKTTSTSSTSSSSSSTIQHNDASKRPAAEQQSQNFLLRALSRSSEELETGLRGGNGSACPTPNTEDAHAVDAAAFPTVSRGPLGSLGSVGQIPAAKWEAPENVVVAGDKNESDNSSGFFSSTAKLPKKMKSVISINEMETEDRYAGVFSEARNKYIKDDGGNSKTYMLLRERSMQLVRAAEEDFQREKTSVKSSELSPEEYKQLAYYNFKKEAFVVLSSSAVFTLFSTGPMVVASQQQAYSTPLVETAARIWRLEGPRGFLKGLLPRWATLTGSILVVSNVINFFDEDHVDEDGAT